MPLYKLKQQLKIWPDANFVLVTSSSQWLGNKPPLSGSIKSSGLQVNDKLFTAEFDDIIRHYLFSLADLFGLVDLYLTIGNQHYYRLDISWASVIFLTVTNDCFGSKSATQ
jgi:hypothetical protein